MYICFVPLGLWAALKWFIRPADPDLESDEVCRRRVCFFFFLWISYFPGSLYTGNPNTCLHLWLFVGRLYSRFDFMGNSSIISSMDFGYFGHIPIRFRFGNCLKSSAKKYPGFIDTGCCNNWCPFFACCWIYALFFPCSWNNCRNDNKRSANCFK